MYQQDRGSYRKGESIFTEFSRSCLGKIVFALGFLTLLAIFAIITRPSEETMRNEILDDVRQSIEEGDSIQTDWIDDAINNASYIFTASDTTANGEIMKKFMEQNRLEYYDHMLFSTMRIYNNFHVEGMRCGIGIFGIVIPTVKFSDFLYLTGTLRKDYNQPIIISTTVAAPEDEEYFGESPDLGGVFEYEGD